MNIISNQFIPILIQTAKIVATPLLHSRVAKTATLVFGVFSIAAAVSPKFRDFIKRKFSYQRASSIPQNDKITTIFNQLKQPETYTSGHIHGAKNLIQKNLVELAKETTPEEMLIQLETILNESESQTKSDLPQQNKNNIKNWDLKNTFYNLQKYNQSNEVYRYFADRTFLSRDPLRQYLLPEEIKAKKISSITSLFSNFISYIPTGSLTVPSVFEHIEQYPTTFFSVLFGSISPFAARIIWTEIKPLLCKILGDLDALFLKHSGKITCLVIFATMWLIHHMRREAKPYLTDLSEAILCKKIPMRGLDFLPSTKETCENAQREFSSSNPQSILLTYSQGCDSNTDKIVEMFQESALCGRNDYPPDLKITVVHVSKLLQLTDKEIKHHIANLKSFCQKNPRHFLYFQDFEKHLYLQNETNEKGKSTKIDSTKQILKEYIITAIEENEIRAILSLPGHLSEKENFKRTTVISSPSINNEKELYEIYKTTFHSYEHGLPLSNGVLESIARLPEWTRKQNRPFKYEETFLTYLKKCSNKQKNLLKEAIQLKNEDINRAVKELAILERKFGPALEMKEKLLKKYWCLKKEIFISEDIEPKTGSGRYDYQILEETPVQRAKKEQLTEIEKKITLISRIIIPAIGQSLREAQDNLNALLSEDQKISFELDAQSFNVEMENALHINLGSNEEKIQQFNLKFSDTLKILCPGRDEQVNAVYTALYHHLTKPRDNISCNLLLGGLPGLGKTTFADYVSKIHYEIFHNAEIHEMSPQQIAEKVRTTNDSVNSMSVNLNDYTIPNGWEKLKKTLCDAIYERPNLFISLQELDKAPELVANLLEFFDGSNVYRPEGNSLNKYGERETEQIPKGFAVFLMDGNWIVDKKGETLFTNYAEMEEILKSNVKTSFQQKHVDGHSIDQSMTAHAFADRLTKWIPFPDLDSSQTVKYINIILNKIKKDALDRLNTFSGIDIQFDNSVKEYYKNYVLRNQISLRQLNRLMKERLNVLIQQESYRARSNCLFKVEFKDNFNVTISDKDF
ncbi:MAG: hypothetical protein Tsb0021_06830 [Chlamydiales bacterium]